MKSVEAEGQRGFQDIYTTYNEKYGGILRD